MDDAFYRLMAVLRRAEVFPPDKLEFILQTDEEQEKFGQAQCALENHVREVLDANS